jgi:biotin carboxyl carrier protein
MMTPENLTQVLGWMRAAGVTELDYTEGNARLSLRAPAGTCAGTAPTVPDSAATPPLRAETMVKSPGVGRFVCAENLAPGSPLATGALLGFLDCDGCREGIFAPVAGILAAALPPAGQLIGYGDIVTRLTPEDV